LTFSWAVRVLVVAAAAEFALLRVVLRVGPVVPRNEATEIFFGAVTLAGTAALNAATILSVLAVALWLRQRGPRQWGLPDIVVGATVALLAVGSLVQPDSLIGLAWSTGLALAAFLLGYKRRAGLAFLPGLAYGTAVLSRVSGLWPGTGFWMGVAEAAVVAFGLALFATNLRHRHWLQLAAGLLPGFGLVAGLSLTGWMVKAVGIWALGISFYLPAPFYGLALAGFIWHVLAYTRGTGRAGLLLMGLAGLRTDFSYLALLSLTGLLAWTGRPFGPEGGWAGAQASSGRAEWATERRGPSRPSVLPTR
jgi:hypothetical protein